MPETLVQSSSNYTRYDAYLSRLRYARVPLNNQAGSSLTFGNTSTGLAEFKIPARKVHNIGQSLLSYSYTLANAAAGTYVCSFENNQDFASWAYLGNSSGMGLCDLNYADMYTSMIMPLRHSHQDMETRDPSNTLYLPQNGNYNQSNVANNFTPFSIDGQLNAANLASTQGIYINPPSPLDPQYVCASPLAAPLTRNRMLPLSVFKDTAIGMNKNMVYPEDMYLRFNTQITAKMGFTEVQATGVQTAYSAAVTVSNIYLFLALEENKILVDSLLSELDKGFTLSIPYTYPYRYSGSSAASQNVSITITKQNGRLLKRLLYGPFNGANNQQGATAFDRSNAQGAKISTIQSSIDARPLTDYALNCVDPNFVIQGTSNMVIPPSCGFTATTSPFGDDWREMSKYCFGSCISNYRSYQANWFYADVFGLQGSLKSLNQLVDDSNIEDGFILNSDHIYSIQMNCPAIVTASSNCGTGNVNTGIIIHYIFALYERDIHISNAGIQFVASR